MCVYLHSETDRHSLFDSIWHTLARELEERQLETEEDDLLEVLQGFGTHVMRQAYLCTHADKDKGQDKLVEQGSKTPDTLPLDQEDEEMMEE